MKQQIIVIKLGTSVLTAGGIHLHKPRMVELVRQCAELKQQGHHIVLVSSGAVAAGRSQLSQPCGDSIAQKQMLAAIGQGQLIHLWQTLFALYDIPVAQMLLTRADVEHRERYLTARDTLTQLLKHQVVPIINENDAVATSEIKVGDNDNLSAMVAILANANKLILLTDQAGLFTADPRIDPDAQLIAQVNKIDDALRALAGDSGTSLGTGGMNTKLQAADIAQRAGIETVIAKGSETNIVVKVMEQVATSTTFIRFDAPLDGRKKWLLCAPKSTGTITIDIGACEAIAMQGASLLAKGVMAVTGRFTRGDLVTITNPDGQLLAKGLCAFSEQELGTIKGCHSSDIANCLGYKASNVIVHRDDMVLL
ncbi:Glutamate 5-kinase [Pseudoalteromonas holothuriae]|uniref:Glutamate 5-kinase n=1 Tax=Pseudoalteromonas holothuriae TaxID=2963714 RepID=A0ABM9GGR7_9GAMM|nr:glutamate 5-kinase [Pseudoalteromonas sp. CIP111951]CAH9056556.1 Glutamate 5-kinase [Pseudoalteromonas sp. CIP111951]